MPSPRSAGKWTSRTGADWTARKVFSSSSRVTPSLMSEVVYSVKMSSSSLRSLISVPARASGGLAHEVLLARRTHEVVVVVAEAHVLERLEATEALIAGLDVDLRGPRTRAG